MKKRHRLDRSKDKGPFKGTFFRNSLFSWELTLNQEPHTAIPPPPPPHQCLICKMGVVKSWL